MISSKIKYKCIECKEDFFRFPSYKRNHGKPKYCSHKCKSKSTLWREKYTGKNNSNYKGYKTTVRGYIMIRDINSKYSNGESKYIFEHRIVAEKMIGRKLDKEEVVHHLNGIRTDNRPENLKIMLKNYHDSLGRTYIYILQERIRHLEKLIN